MLYSLSSYKCGASRYNEGAVRQPLLRSSYFDLVARSSTMTFPTIVCASSYFAAMVVYGVGLSRERDLWVIEDMGIQMISDFMTIHFRLVSCIFVHLV